MNIATYAPSLTLMYVFGLLWILMGVDPKSFSRRDRWVIPFVALFLCFANDLLRKLVGQAVYSKLLILTISNGLENALRAASQPEVADQWVGFSCYVRQGNIFMLIQNPYAGQVVIRDGLPVSSREGHGYGCYSIQAITQRNGGLCSFEANDGLFSLRLSFPLHTDASN